VIIAGLTAKELFRFLSKAPELLDRCLVVDLDDFNVASLFPPAPSCLPLPETTGIMVRQI
jgi:hypothetical protein